MPVGPKTSHAAPRLLCPEMAPPHKAGQGFFLSGQRRDALVVEFLVAFTEAKWTVSRQKKDMVQGTRRLHAICWERRDTQAWLGLLGEKLLKHEEAAEK